MPTTRSVSTYAGFYDLPQSDNATRSLGLVSGQAVWLSVGFLELALVLRFAFRLFAAPDTSIPHVIYRLTEPIVTPLLHIINPMRSDGLIFEVATLLTMFAIALIGVVLSIVIEFLRPKI